MADLPDPDELRELIKRRIRPTFHPPLLAAADEIESLRARLAQAEADVAESESNLDSVLVNVDKLSEENGRLRGAALRGLLGGRSLPLRPRPAEEFLTGMGAPQAVWTVCPGVDIIALGSPMEADRRVCIQLGTYFRDVKPDQARLVAAALVAATDWLSTIGVGL